MPNRYLKLYGLAPLEWALKTSGKIAAVGSVFGRGNDPFERALTGFQAVKRMADGYATRYDFGMDLHHTFYEQTPGLSDIFKLATKYGPKAVQYLVREYEFMRNAVENVSQRPWETAAVAGSLLALGYLLGEGVEFYRTEGRGGVWAEAKRGIGRKWFGWKEEPKRYRIKKGPLPEKEIKEVKPGKL